MLNCNFHGFNVLAYKSLGAQKSPRRKHPSPKSRGKKVGDQTSALIVLLRNKRLVVIDARRCWNCLSVVHFVRTCSYSSKCRKCDTGCQKIHAGALHECYKRKKLGASEINERAVPASENNDGERDLNICKVKTNHSFC